MKKLISILLLLALVGCKPDEITTPSGPDYIDSKFLPLEGLYWGMPKDDALELIDKSHYGLVDNTPTGYKYRDLLNNYSFWGFAFADGTLTGMGYTNVATGDTAVQLKTYFQELFELKDVNQYITQTIYSSNSRIKFDFRTWPEIIGGITYQRQIQVGLQPKDAPLY